MTEHLHTWKLTDGTYLVKSRKMAPGAFHRVTPIAQLTSACDCQGYFYRHACAHSDAVNKRLKREPRVPYRGRDPFVRSAR